MPDREDIAAVLDRHLAGPGRSGGPELRAEALALVEPLGLELPGVNDELAVLLEHAQTAGLGLEHAEPVVQAYVRALGRIVEAEVAHLHGVLRDVEPARHAEALDRLLPAMLSTALGGFDAVHRALLHAALADELLPGDVPAPDATLTVALVDLSGSTRYLQRASMIETQELVDGLFRAGQAASRERPVRVVKYVGDGFFLAGRAAAAVVEAATDAVRLIERELPLAARAGVAAGPVLRRAGDLFGLPVNLAQVLTKAAPSGTVLVTAAVAAELGDVPGGEPAQVPGPGDQPVDVVSLRA